MYSACTPILPRIVLGDLKRSQEDLGFLYSLYPLFSLFANPFVGYVTDAVFPYKPRRDAIAIPGSYRPGTDFVPRSRLITLGTVLMLCTALVFSQAKDFYALCGAKLMHAMVDAFLWILGLSIWERYCSEKRREAAWVEREWEWCRTNLTEGGLELPSRRPQFTLPNASFGESLILASNWIGQVVSLPMAGYLFDNGLWVFGPVVVLSTLLIIGWLLVDFRPNLETLHVASVSADIRSRIPAPNIPNTDPASADSRPPSPALSFISSTSDNDTLDESHPLLASTSLGPADSLHSHPAPPPSDAPRRRHRRATNTNTASLLSWPIFLVSIPVFLSIFVSAGLEPTLPSHLHFRFGATPSEVGGFYMVWSIAYIFGLLTAGKVVETLDRMPAGDTDVESSERKPNRGSRGLILLVIGMTFTALVAPLASLPGTRPGPDTPPTFPQPPDSALPPTPFQPLGVKLFEVAALALLGFVLGFTLSPTLPELNRIAKGQIAAQNMRANGKDDKARLIGNAATAEEHSELTNEGTGAVGSSAVVAALEDDGEGGEDVDIGATLYGLWLLVYSVGMMVSEPLSAHVYATYGFLTQLLMDSTLLLLVGVPAIILLLRRETPKRHKEAGHGV
ncbi:hypothetical protein HDU93_003548 [Gonapodya sp. JEL0774]|nr:hypothetical protein HDU93_003548 [Gonapodya sp. JEL0774]